MKQFRLFVLTPFLALASMLALAGGIIYVMCAWFLTGDE